MSKRHERCRKMAIFIRKANDNISFFEHYFPMTQNFLLAWLFFSFSSRTKKKTNFSRKEKKDCRRRCRSSREKPRESREQRKILLIMFFRLFRNRSLVCAVTMMFVLSLKASLFLSQHKNCSQHDKEEWWLIESQIISHGLRQGEQRTDILLSDCPVKSSRADDNKLKVRGSVFKCY